MAHISGHNSSYKREPLLALGEGLSAMLEAESTMQWRLGEEGHSFYFEPLARVRHYNFSRMADSLWLHFHLGWLFGANRFRPRDPRRLVYLAGWPFIAPLRLLRALRDAARVGTQVNLPVLLTLLGFNALGEAVGYAIGRSGPPMAACTASEYGRSRYLTAADRARFLAEPTGHSPGIAASSLRL